MKITDCKYAHRIDPLGCDAQPVFSWLVQDKPEQGVQARIVVTRDGAPVADTGWGDLDCRATAVEMPLRPRTRYEWTVSVRADGQMVHSGPQWFETAKMGEPWSAEWIGCDDSEPRHPVFFRDVKPKAAVRRARLYACGLGLYEVCWNGVPLDGELLAPGCTDYTKWVQYQTYDVTARMQRPGRLSFLLGNGWYKGRFIYDNFSGKPFYSDQWKLIAELHIEYEDGSREVIGTDESWQVARSNITFSNLYDGEKRDDTLPELPPSPACKAQAPGGVLTARLSPGLAVREELPCTLLQTDKGEVVFDAGQNLAGVFRLWVHEPRGTRIRLQFGEILQNGGFYRNNLRTAKAEYVYVCDGTAHYITPKFTYYGYRYVKAEGLTNPRAEDLTALAVYSDVPKTGWLHTGHPLLNRFISNVEWSLKSNFLDVPTDCPQRDERMGWTGDAQVFCETACYLRDSFAFYDKYLRDIAAAQALNGGLVPVVVPPFGKTDVSAAWGDVACVIPWMLYRFFGDKEALARHYPVMAAWVEAVLRIDGTDHGWRRHFHFGDWLALDGDRPADLNGGTDKAFLADACLYRSLCLTEQAAAALGRETPAAHWHALAQDRLTQMHREYFTATGRCSVATQTGLAISLMWDITPDPTRTARELQARMKASGGQLRTGFVGTPLLCAALTKAGLVDQAFNLLVNEDCPGWLFEVKMGATTVWEHWDSVKPDGTIDENGMNSLNHYAYGSVLAWLWSDVAGLAPAAPGFAAAELAPHVHPVLGHIQGRYQSVSGCWECGWDILKNGDISYHCTVPDGCTAHLVLPYGGGQFELGAGDFAHTYTPDTPLIGRFGLDSTMEQLLDDPRARAVLVEAVPQAAQMPPQARSLTLRALADAIGRQTVDDLEKALASI